MRDIDEARFRTIERRTERLTARLEALETGAGVDRRPTLPLATVPAPLPQRPPATEAPLPVAHPHPRPPQPHPSHRSSGSDCSCCSPPACGSGCARGRCPTCG